MVLLVVPSKAYLGQIEAADTPNPIGIPGTVNRPQPPGGTRPKGILKIRSISPPYRPNRCVRTEFGPGHIGSAGFGTGFDPDQSSVPSR
jgi:hypothetical protein